VNKKAGFIDMPVEIASVGSDMTQAIYMTPVYNVAFRALDNFSYNPVAGATVIFNGVTETTDADGFAYFNNIPPAADPYGYSVAGNGPYSTVTGEVILPFTSTEWLLLSNNNVTVNAELSSPGIYMVLVTGMMTYFGQATITLDGIDYAYDPGFGAVIINCGLGTHNYIVTPEDNSKAIIRGTVEVVSANEKAFVEVSIKPARKIEIYVINEASEPIEGASVTLNGNTVLTDLTGLALFDRYPEGSYTYTITMENYLSKEETALDVNTSDVMEVVTLIAANTGIKETSAETVKLYPNPTSGILNITLPANNGTEATIRITNIIGSDILNNKVVNGSGQVKLDVSGFDTGIYFVTVKGKGYERTIKVVKK
jgi:hypothetical protein